MGPLLGESNFSCSKCKNPVAFRHELLSKAMRVKSGPAYLFSNAMNIVVGPKMDREMLSGIYTVADISCSQCGEVLGWKYIRARETRDKFKEGTYVLERAKLVKEYHEHFRNFMFYSTLANTNMIKKVLWQTTHSCVWIGT